jgi:hypothetical protein
LLASTSTAERREKGIRPAGSLFTDDVLLEVPGGWRTVGLEAVSAWWEDFQRHKINIRCDEPVIISGNEAVAIIRSVTGPDQKHDWHRVVNQFVFNDDGKMAQVRFFVG